MLAYAFSVLRQEHYKKIETETFDHAGDLFAAILALGMNHQIKRGLQRDYRAYTEALRSPRGKIDVTLSVKQQSLLRKQLVCTFDDYTENTYMNQILKSTAL